MMKNGSGHNGLEPFVICLWAELMRKCRKSCALQLQMPQMEKGM